MRVQVRQSASTTRAAPGVSTSLSGLPLPAAVEHALLLDGVLRGHPEDEHRRALSIPRRDFCLPLAPDRMRSPHALRSCCRCRDPQDGGAPRFVQKVSTAKPSPSEAEAPQSDPYGATAARAAPRALPQLRAGGARVPSLSEPAGDATVEPHKLAPVNVQRLPSIVNWPVAPTIS